jgi:hypothetical protein
MKDLIMDSHKKKNKPECKEPVFTSGIVIKLPSNRSFGFFFTAIFMAAIVYFFLNNFFAAAYICSVFAIILLLVTLIKSEVLFPLNKLWMRFGLMLGKIISPLILGLIFFLLFTPIAFIIRLFGRDELRLKFKDKSTYWIKRNTPIQTEPFKQQF